MKVLVATAEGQGMHEGDFCWTLEGELVLTGSLLECSAPATCGCGRGFPGLGSARATTTAMVADRPELARADLLRAIRDSLERQGWLQGLPPGTADEIVEDEADRIRWTATTFATGSVLSREGDQVWRRLGVAA